MAENILESPISRTEPVARPASLSVPRVGWRLWFALVLIVAATLRFVGLAWDGTHHLHPDERFMTMVASAIQWPSSVGEYFDTARSPLSPYNHRFGLYVYGTLPLYLVKAVGLALDQSGYDQIHLVGRFLAGLFDVGTVAVTVLLGRRLYSLGVGLLGGGLYAIMAFPIQQAHFFAVDSYSAFFAVLAALITVTLGEKGRWRDYAVLGAVVGLGMACKISMFVLAGFAVLGAGLVAYRELGRGHASLGQLLEWVTPRLLLSGAVAFVVFRIAQPIAFQGPAIYNLGLNEQWLANMAEVQGLQSGERDFPPGHQWTDRPALWFPWSNMVVWGMGVPLGVVAWLGWGLATYELVRHRRLSHLIPVAFIGAVFLYQGSQWVKSMRYFLHLYPFLALTAAFLMARLWQSGALRAVLRPAVIGVVVLTALYAVAFTSIYTRPHSRVEASRWIYDDVPRGSVLANEHWDDPLPLRLDGRDAFGGIYRGVQINNYDDDTPKKLDELIGVLTQADYIVLSSNRLYDSIPRLPMRYPMTTRYYELLFAEQLGFRRVATFTSYPGLFGIELPDQGAEEAWSVYDHPKVTLFQKTSELDRAKVRAQLGDGIDWDGILRLRPDQATKARSLLLLSEPDQALYQASGTWRSYFSTESLGNQAPALVWWLALQLVGLCVLPMVLRACRPLVDGGYGIAKPVGMLLVSWLVWLAASVRLASFGPALVIGVVATLAGISAVIAVANRERLRAFLRARWRLLALEEAVFTAGFLAFVMVRAANPDLWHPVMGGEKPMDLAYLNAVIRSAHFPPYDPWFAGGYINYYYFGFVIVATLTHLTGIVPWVVYNLAVPTFFAATLGAAFVVALNLAQQLNERATRSEASFPSIAGASIVAGLSGAVAVAVLGNFGQLRLIVGGLFDLGRPSVPIPIIGPVMRTVDGARELVLNGRALPFRTEWWYWNATRVIPHPPGEAGPINEFPYFTFLYGDLHAHMMALPFTLVALALAVSLIRQVPRGARSFASRMGRGFPLTTVGLLALTIGALWPLNTWDLPTFALVAGAALLWRASALEGGRLSVRCVTRSMGQWLGIMLVAYLAFLPFHRAYAAGYSSVELWKGSRTPVDAYLIIHGIFLFVILTGLALRLTSRAARAPVGRELRILIAQGYRPGRLFGLMGRLVHRSPMHRLALAASLASLLLVLGLSFMRAGAVALALLTLLLAVLALTDPRADARHRLAYTFIALGAVLTMAVEYIVIKGDISRMNTVFKFYLQVWTLWGLSAAVMVPDLLRRGPAHGTDSVRDGALTAPVGGLWRSAFAAIVVAGLLYPIFATYVRAQDRFEGSNQVSLNGIAYMEHATYADKGQTFSLRWDKEAILWLLQNVNGSPVIVEAVTPLYRWGSRVSINTGLPAVIGWDWHQKQQRAVLPGEVVDRRINDVNQIYGPASADRTRELLGRYDVRLIYVGQLERLYYPGVDEKMRRLEGQLWNRVYQNPEVAIYEVRP